MERAERSGGLHKRSAEAWGHPLRARGAELPLGVFAVVVAVRNMSPRRRKCLTEAGPGSPGHLLDLRSATI